MLSLKIGRKKLTKFLPQMMKNIEGYINFQNYMWIMINDSLKKYVKKNKIQKRVNPYAHDVFEVNMYPTTEKLDDEYNIEWIVCDIKGNSYEDEVIEFKELEKFENTLKENFESNRKNFTVNKPTPLKSAIMNKVIKTKESVFEVIEKGLDQKGDRNISQFLLDLDIIIVKEPPKK